MSRTTGFVVGVVVLTGLCASSALGDPLTIASFNGPQDDLTIVGWVHELGDSFLPSQAIESSVWGTTDDPICLDGSDDPAIPNVVIEVVNISPTDWYNVHYEADPQTSISNFDGQISNFGLADADEAFRIDSIGLNTPLLFESITADNIFQAGETWRFAIQDFKHLHGGPPAPFGSQGIASKSYDMGIYPILSTGSIIAVPEPSTLALLSMGTLALLTSAWRRRCWGVR